MRPSTLSRAMLLAILPIALGGPTCTPTSTSDLQWYLDCGDPVCHGYDGPFTGVDVCTNQAAGESCDNKGAQCDPENDCNALLVCAASDPTQQQGGCPISRRAFKKDVHYLDPAEEQQAADHLLNMKLATWRYTWDDEQHPAHLGFIIDDVGRSPAVRPDGEHVDLYGYTSLAVATIQAQQRQIDALQKRIEALEAERCASPRR